MRTIRDATTAKELLLPVQRFTYECACGQGTEDAREYEQHATECDRVLEGVRAVIRRQLAQGKPVAVPPPGRPTDREGQQVLPGLEGRQG